MLILGLSSWRDKSSFQQLFLCRQSLECRKRLLVFIIRSSQSHRASSLLKVFP